METPHTKDPERVRLGRLGALAVHARGRTNVAPARAAWEASLATEFGITEDVDPVERERRMQSALRVRMSRLAAARWAKRRGKAAARATVTSVAVLPRRKAASPSLPDDTPDGKAA